MTSCQGSAFKPKKKDLISQYETLRDAQDYTSCISMGNAGTRLGNKMTMNNIQKGSNKYLKRFRRTIGVPSTLGNLNSESSNIYPKNLFYKKQQGEKKVEEICKNTKNKNMDSSESNAKKGPLEAKESIQGFETKLYLQKIVGKSSKCRGRRKNKFEQGGRKEKNSKVRRISISHRSRNKNKSYKKFMKTYTKMGSRQGQVNLVPNLTKEVKTYKIKF